MKTTSYKVTFLNEKGDFEGFETFNRLEADLKVSECVKNNFSGYLEEIIKIRNNEFPQCNKTNKNTIKIW